MVHTGRTGEKLSTKGAAKRTYQHGEKEVADQLGLPLRSLRSMRMELLERKVDWDLVSNRVMYCQEALVKLARALPGLVPKDVNPRNTEAGLAGASAEKTPAREEIATVTRLWRNPHYIQGQVGQELVRIHVRNKRMFKAGMEIPVRQVQRDLWEFAGGRIRSRRGWRKLQATVNAQRKEGTA